MSESGISQSFVEEAIKREFGARGSPIRPFSSDSNNGHLLDEFILYTNAPFVSVYGHEGHTELLFRHWRGDDIRIECKCQTSSGSVDEKFPYMWLNARDAYKEPEVWFVLECSGAKPESVRWFAKVCAQIVHRKVRVMNLAETRNEIKMLFKRLGR